LSKTPEIFAGLDVWAIALDLDNECRIMSTRFFWTRDSDTLRTINSMVTTPYTADLMVKIKKLHKVEI
jgi:hypothetical protein